MFPDKSANMRVALTAFLTLILSAVTGQAKSQAFFDHVEPYLKKEDISRLGIKKVIATCNDYQQEIHPLSNFDFQFNFDTTGVVVSRTYWKLSDLKNRTATLQLVHDTLTDHPGIYRMTLRSVKVEFDRDRDASDDSMISIFNRLRSMYPFDSGEVIPSTRIKKDLTFSDTIIIGRKVRIPESLVPEGDSVLMLKDTMCYISMYNGRLMKKTKVYIMANGYLRIDETNYPGLSENGVDSYHYISADGLLTLKRYGALSETYFYDENRLHISTSVYSGGRTRIIQFKYER